ncbi:hypothetical protein IV02_11070 [Pseudomonas syringae]|uniref:Uncharacterized protein n=1 Tax=Pseudomonas syringae TaxID=317 RepID=A0A085V8F8_PSESX|nr:hypothetical protein IV02_11070 [Pseudomonas syringae]
MVVAATPYLPITSLEVITILAMGIRRALGREVPQDRGQRLPGKVLTRIGLSGRGMGKRPNAVAGLLRMATGDAAQKDPDHLPPSGKRQHLAIQYIHGRLQQLAGVDSSQNTKGCLAIGHG